MRGLNMSIRILTDSGSDIAQDNPYGITVLPLHISFADEEFLDGVTMDHETFYERLIESDVLPKTSALAPFAFEEAYRKVVDAGDQAIVITLSGKLSGTYQSAVIAADDFEGSIYVVDSESVSVGEQILALYAKELVDSGLDISDILDVLENAKKNIQVVALLDTLEYLKKGGRIGGAAATLGDMLSIKPVVSLVDGEVAVLGKAHGSKNGNNLLIARVHNVGGVDFTKPYRLGYTGLSDKLLQKYIKDSQALWAGQKLPENVSIGGSIGTHVGPGAIAVAFFSA
jgi:DegV family protein with EDD domain